MTATSASRAADEETPRPLRKDAARNREALLAAAREVFAERGLDASMDDVAHRAGVGVGTAYRHFAHKYELVAAIFADEIDGVVARAEEAAQVEDAWQGLVDFIAGTAVAQTTDRGLREVLMGMHPTDEVSDEINARLTPPLRALLDRAKEQDAVRADVEVSDIAVVVMLTCGVADLAGDVAPDLWRRYLPTLLEGLRAHGPTPDVPALDETALRTAMKTHKQRMQRIAGSSTSR